MRFKFLVTIMLLVYLMGFCFSIPYVDYVGASTVVYSKTFEGTTAGQPYSDSFMTSYELVYGNEVCFSCSSTRVFSGTRGFDHNYNTHGTATQGVFNLTYSASGYLTKFSTMWYFQFVGYLTYWDMIAYNNTLGIGYPLIQLYFSSSDYDIMYYNEIGTGVDIYTSCGSAVWKEIGWEIENSNGDVTYHYDTTSVLGVARYPVYIEDGYRIDRIYVQRNNALAYYGYDLMNFTIGDSYEGGGGGIGESYCGVDVSQYASQIGNLYTLGVFSEKSSTQLTSNYAVAMDTTIYAVGLAVDINQYNADDDASNYTLEINGQSIGGAMCFSPYNNGLTSFYILFWDCNVALLNETATFSFTHEKVSSYGWYWTVGQSAYSEDIDNDGDSYFTYEETSTTYSWNWIRIGGIFVPFWLPTTSTVTGVNADLGMTFWAGEINPPVIIDTNYTNTIGLSNWDYKNDTGYVYTIPKVAQEGIVVSYTIAPENQSYDYGIMINFTNSTESGYPFECGDFTASPPIPYPDGVYSCIPTVAGKYEFCMYTMVGGGIEWTGVNVTAWVVGDWSLEDFYIFTNPPTTYQFDAYEVVWKYDHPSDYDGAVAMFNEYYRFQEYGYNGNYLAWGIADSTEEKSEWYNSFGDSAEWWGLYANKTNGYALTVPLHQHNIKLYGVIENKIWALPSTLAIPTVDDVGKYNVVIYYQHRFVGTNIAIYIDDIYFQPVGDASSGDKTYTPYVAGTHTIKLKLDQNGTLVTVAQNTFRVTIAGSGGGGGGGGGAGGTIIPTLAQPLGSVVGLIITIFCLLTPFIIGGALHVGGIHPVIYAMTGGLGLAISTIMGLFPVWIPLFVVVCGIIVIVIFYLRGATASSE